MPPLTRRGVGVLGTLFPKVGLPSNTCANLCGARWRVAARREPTAGCGKSCRAISICDLGFSRLYGYSLRARARAHAWFFLHIFKIWVLLLRVERARARGQEWCFRHFPSVVRSPVVSLACARACAHAVFLVLCVVYCSLQCALSVS